MSAAVIVFLVAYALTSPSFRLETAASALEAHAGAQAIVQGRVLSAGGDGISDAEIRVRRAGVRAKVARSGERGYFRVALAGACAASHIDLAVRTHGTDVRDTVTRTLCPGQALELDSRLVGSGQLIWMPTR